MTGVGRPRSWKRRSITRPMKRDGSMATTRAPLSAARAVKPPSTRADIEHGIPGVNRRVPRDVVMRMPFLEQFA